MFHSSFWEPFMPAAATTTEIPVSWIRNTEIEVTAGRRHFFHVKGVPKKKMKEFTHFDQHGNAVMVDVTDKQVTVRTAVARGEIRVSSQILQAVKNRQVKKGDVLGVAQVAGIMGTKQTSSLIPMCHPLNIQKCSVDFEIDEEHSKIVAICMVKTEGKTGVEMEALTGVSAALLTIYDMCKAIDKRMEMGNIHLVEKTGGKSGDFQYDR